MTFSWQKAPKPIIGLSPMDGITDFAFRQIQARFGKPAVIFTEFTNVEGMFLAAHDHLFNDLMYHVSQRPIIAQIFGSTPEYFYNAAIVCSELGFDGIDINMGCPAKNVAHHGGGAALIADPPKAKEIILYAKKGVFDWANGKSIESIGLSKEKITKIQQLKHISTLSQHQIQTNYFDHFNTPQLETTPRTIIPVSVKTRIGINTNTISEWVRHLLEVEPANITIHGRTLKQMYTGLADWEAISQAAELVNKTGTTIIGNGDIVNLTDAYSKIQTYNLDGVLIGRAAIGNPFIFTNQNSDPLQKLKLAREHAILHAKFKNTKLFLQMRKHFSFYITNFPYANEIKVQLIKSENIEQALTIIDNAIIAYSQP